LVVRRPIHAKEALTLRRDLDRDSIEAIEVCAVDREQVDLTLVAPREAAIHVGSDASRGEDDAAAAQPPRLALNSKEHTFGVDG
jgi:hypothetical protein